MEFVGDDAEISFEAKRKGKGGCRQKSPRPEWRHDEGSRVDLGSISADSKGVDLEGV